MSAIHVWPVCIDAYHAISRYYVPVMDEMAAEYGLPEGDGWLLLPAVTFDPEVISAEKLRVRSPYTSTFQFQTRLEKLASGGFLIPEPGNDLAYRLSPLGREAIFAIIKTGYDCMQTLQPLAPDVLENLAQSLFKLVNACLEAPQPPGKWSITYSRKLDPGQDAPVMVRIDQYLSDLAAYRDDCHLAAWQIHQIVGHSWEMLTVLWRNGPLTLDRLCEQLALRGGTRGEYQVALADLIMRGWVKINEGDYCLAELGGKVREAAEANTDGYFYRPWSCLSEKERADLIGQIISLKDAL